LGISLETERSLVVQSVSLTCRALEQHYEIRRARQTRNVDPLREPIELAWPSRRLAAWSDNLQPLFVFLKSPDLLFGRHPAFSLVFLPQRVELASLLNQPCEFLVALFLI